MTMSPPLQPTLWPETELKSTPSAEASPVRTYHSLASALALKVRDLVCGASTGVSLARYDHASSSWKTCQDCLVSGWEPFSETWPRSGMMLSGTVYRLLPSAPLTGGTGSGSLPTPRAEFDSGGNRGAKDTLHSYVKMWPTPHGFSKDGRSNGPSGNELGRAVNQSLRMWPTPAAGDDRDRGCMKMPSIQRRARLGKQLNLSMVVDPDSGSLNADWVEWLMGFPTGWTNTPGYKNPKKPRASSKDKKTAPTG